MHRLAFICCSAALLLAADGAGAAVRITEILAENSAGLANAAGGHPDWIELHNPDASSADISGFHLTDDPELPAKYVIPAGTVIPAGGYRVVFAESNPAFPAGYTDAAGNLHANFSLDASGEYLALSDAEGRMLQEFAPVPALRKDISWGEGSSSPPVVQTVLVAGAAARWRVPVASDAALAWRDLAFDDTAWNAASTGIGYGSGYTPGAGGNTSSAMWFGNPTVWLRVPFSVTNAAAVTQLTLRLKFEDGFSAFINGHPVAARNAPAVSALTWNSTATAAHPNAEAASFAGFTFTLPAGVLREGGNILAIHGLNLSASGTDSSDFFLLPELDTSVSGPVTRLFFPQPTPGAVNATAGVEGFVGDTVFSVDRGWKTAPFDVAVTCATPGASIRYTLDGSPPSESAGTLYTGPIHIDRTTTLRAAAYKAGFAPADIDTQTYLFLASVLRQPASPPGYPATWAGKTADYEMDPEVVNDPAYSQAFGTAFAALPALSLVFKNDDFFSTATGIYQNPLSEGPQWERPVSVELIPPDGTEQGFQIDAGARVQGGSSRNPDTPKHSLSLRFRREFGSGKLGYPVFKGTPFGAEAQKEFDYLQLRPEYNFGWMHRHFYQCAYALYGRDQFASDVYLAMGRGGMRGRWVHLFLNGLYWGLYCLHERPDEDHMAAYCGGLASDYDTVNSAVATGGDLVAFNAMMDIAYGSAIGTAAGLAQIEQYLDLDAFADYMLVNAYIGNRDWDGHNWRAARRRAVGAKFHFFPWDSEFAFSHVAGGVFNPPPGFESTTLNTNVLTKNTNRNPTGLQTRLELNPEYRLRYADRVRKHFFNDGAVTPASAAALWNARSPATTAAIVAESARWGDFRRDVAPGSWSSNQFALYTRDQHYLPVQQWLLNTYFPQRTGIVLAQLRARNLYPAVSAPDFSRYSGALAGPFALSVTAAAPIYLTLDGSDPRATGGAINASAQLLTSGASVDVAASGPVKARARTAAGEWSALTEAFFTIGTGQLVLTEIMYRPATNPLAEFLEITNTGTATVSLRGLHFTDGIEFAFDAHSTLRSLAPGARLLIVRDAAAFAAVYGNAHQSSIAGAFQNSTSLSNGGETITLSDATGAVVLQASYGDSFPWPEEADGGSYSLVYSGGQPSDPLSWRRSLASGGSPAAGESLPESASPLERLAPELSISLGGVPATAVLLTVRHELGADGIQQTIEHSIGLSSWRPLDAAPELVARSTEGTRQMLTWRVTLPSASTRHYLRVNLSSR